MYSARQAHPWMNKLIAIQRNLEASTMISWDTGIRRFQDENEKYKSQEMSDSKVCAVMLNKLTS